MRVRISRLWVKVYLTLAAFVVLFGAATSVVGIRYIDRLVVEEGRKRIASYLNAARSLFRSEQAALEQTISLVAASPEIRGASAKGEGDPAALERARTHWELDYLGVTDVGGRVLARGRFPHNRDDYIELDCLAGLAEDVAERSCARVLPPERLVREGKGLRSAAHIAFRETPMASSRPEQEETSGMVLEACSPVLGEHREILGYVYGGLLLNRNNRFVDTIQELLFGDESYEGRQVGTVTLFQWDLRIATNVKDGRGERAIGTRVSSSVHDTVLVGGKSWLDRAFVVNDWYLSAYDPVRDSSGEIIGMLYVGELLARYDAMHRSLVLGFLALTVAGALLVLLLSLLASRTLVQPISRLTRSVRDVSSGRFDVTIPVMRGGGELAELERSFRTMVRELKARDEQLSAANERLGAANDDLRKTNQYYLDMLCFVSHELRSPLAAVDMALGTLERSVGERLRGTEATILSRGREQLRRALDMSANYLSLSRIERRELSLRCRPVRLRDDVVLPVLARFRSLAESRGMELDVRVPGEVLLRVDPDLMDIVYANLVSNAIKYGREGGRIVLGFEQESDGYRLNVYNEGQGIPDGEAERVFDRFSRLESALASAEKGTGLGLFITRTAVELHGGTITAEGAPGAFANLVIRLPLDCGVTQQ